MKEIPEIYSPFHMLPHESQKHDEEFEQQVKAAEHLGEIDKAKVDPRSEIDGRMPNISAARLNAANTIAITVPTSPLRRRVQTWCL
jgi:hypothetical protein